MTLTLAAPSADPIRTYDNGLKVVRLTEYIGAARGTLSIVADPDGVAGNVVKDEQTVAIPTNFTSKWSSVSDTITIPVADFGYGSQSNYVGYLSLRSEGRPPLTARSGEKFNIWTSAAGPQVALGWDGVQQTTTLKVPREHYANYSMLNIGAFGPNWDGFSSTNVNIRAWGIAGSSPSFAWYLDCLYLIPSALHNTDTGGRVLPTQFAWYVGQDQLEPYPQNPATDNEQNTGDFDAGQKSVFFHPNDTVPNEGVGWDIQEAGSNENTEFDWRFVGFFTDPEKENSYIYWTGLASRLINAHQIEFVDFNGSGPDPSGPGTPPSAFDYVWTTPEGYQVFGAFTAEVGKMYFADDVARFRTYSESFGEVPVSFYPLPADSQDRWDIGPYTHNLDTFSATDPRTYNPEMDSLESFIFTVKCNPIDGIPPQGLNYWLYGTRWTTENSNIPKVIFGPRIYIESTGDATVRFENVPNNVGASPTPVGDTVDVPDNLGTAFWVKIEKRLYFWRVKIWSDGDPEPSSWLHQEHEPSSESNTLAGQLTLPYPWETGFPTTGVTTTTNEPDRLPEEISLGIVGERGWTIGGQIELYAGFDEADGWRWDIDDITIEYDPDLDSVGSYTGANYQLEKYDGSEFWGSVHVAPGMCRLAFSDYAPHHFDNDAHGGNIIVWKDTGGHPLQAAAYGIVRFRRYLQGDIPLFRPRVFSVQA